MYGLLFNQVQVGTTVKIVWRVTGEGPAEFQFVNEAGVRIDPTWGPDPHGDSTFEWPGDEWGTGWDFPAPGCWSLEVTRGDATATAGLEVEP